MKRFFNMIFSRATVTVIMILIQITYLALFFMEILDGVPWLHSALEILSFVMAIYIVNQEDNPAYKIGWLLLMGFFPVFGGLFYLMFGSKKPGRHLRKRLENQTDRIRGLLPQNPAIMEKLEKRQKATARYVAKYGSYPVVDGSEMEYYPNGESMYKAMLESLKSARKYILLEYFIIGEGKLWDEVLAILQEKVKAGVRVMVIYDDIGSVFVLPKHYDEKLRKMGIECLAFNPILPFFSLIMNNRNHRKILVVDGHTAFTGGMNLADEYINIIDRFGHWKDTGIKVYGKAAYNFAVMFLTMWFGYHKQEGDYEFFQPDFTDMPEPKSDGFIQPYADSPLDEEVMAENVYLDILAQAEDHVYIFTPYLAMDNEMITALCNAAKRGVDVRIAAPGIPDKKLVYQLTRSYYSTLIRGGVRVYKYTPGFLHAKNWECDDKIGVVGTINMDYRSLYLHFECGALIYQSSVLQKVKQDALETYAICQEVREEDCFQGFFGHMLSAIMRAFSPLL